MNVSFIWTKKKRRDGSALGEAGKQDLELQLLDAPYPFIIQ